VVVHQSGRGLAHQAHQDADANTKRVGPLRVLVRVDECGVAEARREGEVARRPVRRPAERRLAHLGQADVAQDGAVHQQGRAVHQQQRPERALEKNVGRLDVAVQNALAVQVWEAVGRVAQRRQPPLPVEAGVALEAEPAQALERAAREQQAVVERAAVHQRRDHAWGPRVVAVAEEAHHVAVAAQPKRRHLQQDVGRLKAARALDRHAAQARRQRRKLRGDDFAKAALAHLAVRASRLERAKHLLGRDGHDRQRVGVSRTSLLLLLTAPLVRAVGRLQNTGRDAALAFTRGPLRAFLCVGYLPLLEARRNT